MTFREIEGLAVKSGFVYDQDSVVASDDEKSLSKVAASSQEESNMKQDNAEEKPNEYDSMETVQIHSVSNLWKFKEGTKW